MRVKALKLFNDIKSNKLRKAGEIFETTQKRAEELNLGPHGGLIEVVDKEEANKESGDTDVRKNKSSTKNKNH